MINAPDDGDLEHLRAMTWAEPCPPWCNEHHEPLSALEIVVDMGIEHVWWSRTIDMDPEDGVPRDLTVEVSATRCQDDWDPPVIFVLDGSGGGVEPMTTAATARRLADTLVAAADQLHLLIEWFENLR
ncbi:MAG TPA: hypothetical protein VGD55_06990 [Acidothermaceae bacterium]